MTEHSDSNALFRPLVTQSLVAFACLACLSLLGNNTSLYMATTSILFVYCSMDHLRPKLHEEEPA